MNAREFLKALSGLKDKGWEAKLVRSLHDPLSIIELKKRGERKSRCPITAVCASLSSARFARDNFELAADAIGLSRRLARIVVRAADDQLDSSRRRHMRKALLTALNL